MTSADIRKKFLEFFEKKGHAIVPSSSLVPDDPSVLLTTAGMQQFKKYYTGELDFQKKYPDRIGAVSVQKCFRTSDIDEVGDESHLTFFEMLGNFSFGGYFKEEAIAYAHEFITKEMGLEISYVTVFRGLDSIPRDEKSREIWNSVGVSDVREEGMEDVFWGPTGSGGPCGPTTEIYCKNAEGKDIEIWNIVFNEFFYDGSRDELLSGTHPEKLKKLDVPGVDTGMGLERLAMVAQGKKNIFETDLFVEPFSEWALSVGGGTDRSNRIVIDHLRGAVFLLADGVKPSNKEVGYILRRLIRRSIVHADRVNANSDELEKMINKVVNYYGIFYDDLTRQRDTVMGEFGSEEKKFRETLDKGLQKFQDMVLRREPKGKFGGIGTAWDQGFLHGDDAFDLYQTFGFPQEVMEELCKERGIGFDTDGFSQALERHQEISRAGAEKKFGGHGLLLNTGELKAANEEELKKVTRLHTATHLLQAALRAVLGSEVTQRGSDITADRLRFDFAFSRKLTPDEIAQVERAVNDAVQQSLPMQYKEMPLEEAKKTGALYFFKEKYPDTVKVYFAGDSLDTAFSKEFCGGPHVANTSEVGRFKITKEESVAAGVRRIRATVL